MGDDFATITQKKMTGGLRIDDLAAKSYHIDPGPGALIRSYQFGFDPKKLDGIFISHAHTDHYNDAEVLIEAMTGGMIKNRGLIAGSLSVINGHKNWGPCISKYHKSKSDTLILNANKLKRFDDFTIRGTKTVHGDPTGVGFQWDVDGFKVSYTSDTQYFDNLAKYHRNADVLIGSVIRPNNEIISGHMCSNNFRDLINEIEPELAIMTHFGIKMLNKNPISEAKRITKETGIRTIAAQDGMQIDLNYKNSQSSLYEILPKKSI